MQKDLATQGPDSLIQSLTFTKHENAGLFLSPKSTSVAPAHAQGMAGHDIFSVFFFASRIFNSQLAAARDKRWNPNSKGEVRAASGPRSVRLLAPSSN
jgi:hypothetical protein